MAVEARHLSLFPSQIPSNREMGSFMEGNGNLYGAQMGYGVLPGPLSGTTTATATDALIPIYASAMADSFPAKTPMKSDSGLTYAIPVSRKRPRDAAINDHPLLSFPPNVQNHQSNNRCGSFTFLGEDISLQIQQQQLEIDRFIAEHTEKVRLEIEERRKGYSRRIMAAVEESIVKKLRVKEEEIEKIGKLNWALEERLKSMSVENQIWRDLAQTNEATANALRTNLEQVLARVQDDQEQRHHQHGGGDAAAVMDDTESCCGSNYADANSLKDSRDYNNANTHHDNNSLAGIRLCRNCGKDEPSVLLLPCRHLCLCSVCGPSLHTCPVCKSAKNATLHVNLSSS